MTAPAKDALTPSELVLIHGTSFAVRKRPIKLTIALLIGAGFCAFITYWVVEAMRDGWASRSWPVTQGTIVLSQVIKDESHKKAVYRADVQFTYEVSGRAYRGNRISFSLEGVSSADETGAQRLVEQYPPGKVVSVAYDPSNAVNAVLEPGVRAVSFLILFLILLSTVFSIAIVVKQLPLLLRR
jgi:hypothetical protein